MRRTILVSLLTFAISLAHGATQKVLYTFTGGLDGGQPYAGLITDQAGNLYGVTQTGGAYNKGTVFELTPSESGWTETVLYSFTGGADGAVPLGGLTTDGNGNLLGTASLGGGNNMVSCGTLFELPMPGTSGSFTVLHTFEGTSWRDGCTPAADLYLGAYDSLYGTTYAGFGLGGYGTRFAYYLDTGKYQAYQFSKAMGGQTLGGINDWMSGVVFSGGKDGEGVVYAGFGKAKILYSFDKQPTKMGDYPEGELLTAIVGGVYTMYGTTSAGGANGNGTVYALSQIYSKGKWKWVISLLHDFSGTDGESPTAGPVADAAGNLYGTTISGGNAPRSAGTVFELTPGPQNTWTLTTLYNFTGELDGGNPTSSLIFDSAGNLYGTTLYGGNYGQGVVYEIIP